MLYFQHPRVEVRSKFAEKLVQGLCIHKPKSCKVGRSRGNLPPCMLGLLALLGSDLWMETPELRAMAEALVKEVCVSRHLAVTADFPFQCNLTLMFLYLCCLTSDLFDL